MENCKNVNLLGEICKFILERWFLCYMYALINKETLSFICNMKSVSSEYIAKKSKLTVEKIKSFLSTDNTSLPTIKQAKSIAACLHIPFAALYMKKNNIPLKSIPNIKNFRTIQASDDNDDSAVNIAMIDIILKKDFLHSIDEDLGISRQTFCPVIPDSEDVAEWAKLFREFFQIQLDYQYKCSSSRQFYLYLRNQIEQKGVFIQSFTDVPLEKARGFAIYDKYLPMIGINDDDRYPAKSFSIVHELAHIFKMESSVCNDMFSRYTLQSEEKFCNAVAGEFLVPSSALNIVLTSKKFSKPYTADNIMHIANRFSVSREVIARRLLDMKEIDDDEYDTYCDLFLRELEAEREEQKIARQNGNTKPIHVNVAREAFDRTSSSICKSLYTGYIEEVFSRLDIARHLSIKDKHIDEFFKEANKWIN